VRPFEYEVSPILYKYLRPERIGVLENCKVRFSQRTVFDDDHELQPEYASFGTENEIWRFVLSKGLALGGNGLPANILVKLIAERPKYQAMATEIAKNNIKSIDHLGVFCLTESPNNEQMWTEYADSGKGFVVAFDTTGRSFLPLRTPGIFGKVEYSDEPFGTLLGTMEQGVGPLFRKRKNYAFEAEWRSIRMLRRLERTDGEIYLSDFDPASARRIVINDGSAVEGDIRKLIERDRRYGNVELSVRERAK
jgi:hypothetical protein